MKEPAPHFDFTLNPAPRISVHPIGTAAEPVIIIDGVMNDAAALINYAASGGAFIAEGAAGYPGVRAPAPLDYVERITRTLDPFLRQVFNLGHVALAQAECSFSIVTAAAQTLVPLQRVPHIDTPYPLQFALLHYLCDGDFGGTAFYRHDASGLEIITAENEPLFIAIRNAEMADAPPPQGYIGLTLPHYSKIAAFEAKFDRMLVYRSCLLHCGLIPPEMPLIADPRVGRLTANIFLTYRAL